MHLRKLPIAMALCAAATLLVPALSNAASTTAAGSQTTRVSVSLNNGLAIYDVVAEVRDRSAVQVSDNAAPQINPGQQTAQVDVICRSSGCGIVDARVCRVHSGVVLSHDGTMTVSAADTACSVSFTAAIGTFGAPQMQGHAMWQHAKANVTSASIQAVAAGDAQGTAARITMLEAPAGVGVPTAPTPPPAPGPNDLPPAPDPGELPPAPNPGELPPAPNPNDLPPAPGPGDLPPAPNPDELPLP